MRGRSATSTGARAVPQHVARHREIANPGSRGAAFSDAGVANAYGSVRVVRLVVARDPEPLGAVPLPLTGDPDVAVDVVVVLDDRRRAVADVEVAVRDRR